MFWAVLELLAIGGSIVGLVRGESTLALVSLMLPLHLLLVGLVLRNSFLLLAFFSVLFPLSSMEFLPHSYRDLGLFIGILGLLLFVVVAESLVGHRGARRGPGRVVAGLLILVALAAVTANAVAYLRGYPGRTADLAALLVVLLTLWLYAVVPATAKQVRRLAFLVVGAYTVSYLVLPFLLGPAGFLVTQKTFDSLFGRLNFNLIGMTAAACTGIMLGSVLDARGWLRVVQLLAIAVLLTVVLYSKSRGAWLGVGMAFLYVLARSRSFALLPVVVVLVGILLSFDVFQFAFRVRAEQTGTDDPALLGRLLLWRSAWNAFRSNWLFGIGVENFRYLKYGYGFPVLIDPKRWFNTHHLFLEQFVSLGAAGGTAFLLLPVLALARVDRVVRQLAIGPSRGFAIGVNAGLIAHASHCLLDTPSWHASTFVLWGALIGLALATANVAGGGGDEAVPASAR
ncbi:MAG: O-antigen ligase family protein [bacterium]